MLSFTPDQVNGFFAELRRTPGDGLASMNESRRLAMSAGSVCPVACMWRQPFCSSGILVNGHGH